MKKMFRPLKLWLLLLKKLPRGLARANLFNYDPAFSRQGLWQQFVMQASTVVE